MDLTPQQAAKADAILVSKVKKSSLDYSHTVFIHFGNSPWSDELNDNPYPKDAETDNATLTEWKEKLLQVRKENVVRLLSPVLDHLQSLGVQLFGTGLCWGIRAKATTSQVLEVLNLPHVKMVVWSSDRPAWFLPRLPKASSN